MTGSNRARTAGTQKGLNASARRSSEGARIRRHVERQQFAKASRLLAPAGAWVTRSGPAPTGRHDLQTPDSSFSIFGSERKRLSAIRFRSTQHMHATLLRRTSKRALLSIVKYHRNRASQSVNEIQIAFEVCGTVHKTKSGLTYLSE